MKSTERKQLANQIIEFLKSKGCDHASSPTGRDVRYTICSECDGIPMVAGGVINILKSGKLYEQFEDEDWEGPFTLEQLKAKWEEE